MKAALLVLALLLSACGPDEPKSLELVGHAMGTQYSVQLADHTDQHDVSDLQAGIERKLAHVEQLMSTYMSDSIISRFNLSTATDWFAVLDEFCFSIESALAISALTDGAFDITVGPIVNLWGFGPDGLLAQPPTDKEIEAVLKATGYEHLQADCSKPAIRKHIPGLVLDMSAYGKGYAADRVADFLEELKFEDYLVEIGGELRLRGRNAQGEKWSIGIEAPTADQRQPHTIVRLTDAAVATSGDYRNFFEADGKRYSHTIDPATGRPVTHVLASVTVVDATGARADALATAILVMGAEKGMQLARRENLAVLFLLRTKAGIEARSTPAFDRLRQ